MIRFKIDILQALKEKGYNTNRIRQEKIISEVTLQQIRTGKTPGIKSINAICEILKKQPGQLLEWVPDEEQKPE
jgi:putative transcriptional regulator